MSASFAMDRFFDAGRESASVSSSGVFFPPKEAVEGALDDPKVNPPGATVEVAAGTGAALTAVSDAAAGAPKVKPDFAARGTGEVFCPPKEKSAGGAVVLLDPPKLKPGPGPGPEAEAAAERPSEGTDPPPLAPKLTLLLSSAARFFDNGSDTVPDSTALFLVASNEPEDAGVVGAPNVKPPEAEVENAAVGAAAPKLKPAEGLVSVVVFGPACEVGVVDASKVNPLEVLAVGAALEPPKLKPAPD